MSNKDACQGTGQSPHSNNDSVTTQAPGDEVTNDLNLCPGFTCGCLPVHNSKEEHDAARATEDMGEVERLEAIWKELPNCGNPRCLPYRDSEGKFHPESLCRVCDASIGGILALIATHDRARLDAVLEMSGE